MFSLLTYNCALVVGEAVLQAIYPLEVGNSKFQTCIKTALDSGKPESLQSKVASHCC